MPNMKKSLAQTKELQRTEGANGKALSPKINIAIETSEGSIQPPEIDDIVEAGQENVPAAQVLPEGKIEGCKRLIT